MKTIFLLIICNAFMNLAWYGHLKFKDQPLWLVILASWGLALFEYIFQVPANRIGSQEWSVPQLKILQECVTLVVFTAVAFLLFRSPVNGTIAFRTSSSWVRSFSPSNSERTLPEAKLPGFAKKQEFLRQRQFSLVKPIAARQAGEHDTYCLL